MTDRTEMAGPTADVLAGQRPAADAAAVQDPDIEVTAQDLLVEEVSIDGMCGVY